MDAKITKTRLSRMLSYDWLKIVGVAAALILFWVLIFTTTATRVQSAQQFIVCNYMGNASVTSKLQNSLSDARENGVFTHEVIETSTVDLAIDEATAHQLLQARTATDELDAMLVSQQGDSSTAYTTEDGYKAYERTYLESFVYNYHYGLFNLDRADEDGFFGQLEEYLNGYYTDGYEAEDSLDEEKVEKDFRARIARTKDKRYKKESQIEAGIQGEIERLEKYRAALIAFDEYLEKGYISLVTTVREIAEEDREAYGNSWEGVYSINLCPDSASDKQREALSRIVGYQTTVTDENDEEKSVISARDMNICLFDSNGDEECYRYEGLLYVCDLIAQITAE